MGNVMRPAPSWYRKLRPALSLTENTVFVADNSFTTVTVTYYDEAGSITIGNAVIIGTNTKKFIVKNIALAATQFTINSSLKVCVLETN